MQAALLYHQPESEYAYLYAEDCLHLRLRVGKGQVAQVKVYYQEVFKTLEGTDYYSQTMTLWEQDRDFDYYQVAIANPPKRFEYYFVIEDLAGQTYLYNEVDLYPLAGPPSQADLRANKDGFKLPYLHWSDHYQAPDWAKDTVWYQIFPDRFKRSGKIPNRHHLQDWERDSRPDHDAFYGGDLKGIIQQLDYLQDLGITGLYLCPIFDSSSNHKYNTHDYFKIDPDFGTKEDLKELVTQAHQRGIKVILDAVFNHIGSQAPIWQDVIAKGKKSDYYDWFHINQLPVDKLRRLDDETMNYETFAFVPAMPKWKTTQPQARDYLLKVTQYWIQECDIDGWRLDVANEIDHGFWRAFHQACLALKPDFYIVGEVWHRSQPWLQGDQFHAVMNYPLQEIIEGLFMGLESNRSQWLDQLGRLRMTYRQSCSEAQFNLLDSHDTMRLFNKCGQNLALMQASLAFLFLQVGSPCIYYGTEIAMAGGDDPDCRRPMPWDFTDSDRQMQAFIQALISLRHSYNSLINQGHHHESLTSKGSLKLEIDQGPERLLAYFNLRDEALSLEEQSQSEPVFCQGYQAGTLTSYGFVVFAELNQ
ncbi:glycoside hydrolase family 13 protein [Eremococcus coleocola]|uniref:Alpha amylase, catalytic domain protein n=1 Tax=Eremococcus coleocola ACS-139-V-Col8 TaxID=908337 RepID=E4KNC0_9LACT|nr:glycoside hydrolase family 13 protein [Eremococcus coleocola]EFR31538.1 alpha amylase, catalytic domain protein [Eremococcus coleocola ACS-139-V-Col8]